MKKLLKRIIFIIVMIIIINAILSIFKKSHVVNYSIKNNKINVNINETYKNKKYYFVIKANDKKFSFSYDNRFNKRKRVVKDIIVSKEDDMLCIFPILSNDNYYGTICNKDNVLYNGSYFSKLNIDDILQKRNLKTSKKRVIKDIQEAKVYLSNIPDDTYIYVWKYNGFITINNEDVQTLDIFSNDTYINKLGIKVDKYYILPNYDEKYEYKKLFIINMTNNRIKELVFDKKDVITNDYVNNGIINNKLYLFDVDNYVQYEINPKKNKYKKVGNKKDGFVFYDKEKVKVNYFDLKNKQTFNYYSIEELNDYQNIINDFDSYYYVNNDDVILYNATLKEKMYLFHFEEVNSLFSNSSDLYFISGNTLYRYNLLEGLSKILVYDELLFNKTNRYSIYKK